MLIFIIVININYKNWRVESGGPTFVLSYPLLFLSIIYIKSQYFLMYNFTITLRKSKISGSPRFLTWLKDWTIKERSHYYAIKYHCLHRIKGKATLTVLFSMNSMFFLTIWRMRDFVDCWLPAYMLEWRAFNFWLSSYRCQLPCKLTYAVTVQ